MSDGRANMAGDDGANMVGDEICPRGRSVRDLDGDGGQQGGVHGGEGQSAEDAPERAVARQWWRRMGGAGKVTRKCRSRQILLRIEAKLA